MMMRRFAWLCLQLLALAALFAAHPAAAAPELFGQPIRITTTTSYGFFNCHVLDYDGDGDTDVIQRDDYNAWRVLENDGKLTPSFTPRPLTFTLPASVAGGSEPDFQLFDDVTGDGRPDCLAIVDVEDRYQYLSDHHLLFGSCIGAGRYAFQEIAVASFSYAYSLGELYSSFKSFHLIDLDGDGQKDIVYLHEEVNEGDAVGKSWSSIYWARNLGGDPVKFAAPAKLFGDNDKHYDPFFLADFNRDGKLDLLVERYGEWWWWDDWTEEGETVLTDHRLVLNLATAASPPTFSSGRSLRDFGKESPCDIRIQPGDYDGDTDSDILIGGSHGLLALRNPGSGAGDWTSATLVKSLDSGVQSWSIQPNISGPSPNIFLNKLDGCHVLERSAQAPGGFLDRLVVPRRYANDLALLLDFNHDGKTDFLGFGKRYHTLLRLFLNNASFPLYYYPVFGQPDGYYDAEVIACSDLNGDSYPDLLLRVPIPNDDKDAALVWLPNRMGEMFAYRDLATGQSGPEAVCAADLDRDGHLDALSASTAGGYVAWHRNSGQPAPSFPGAVLACGLKAPVDLCTADLDRDGDLDVVVAERDAGAVVWLENEGLAPPRFTRRVLTSQAAGAQAVSAADVDKDGDIDVLAASPGNNIFWWLENNGAAQPAFRSHKLVTSALGSRAITAADLDGDGDRDILCGSRDDNKIFWLQNNGAKPPSFFVKRTITTLADSVRDLRAADLDHDGDLDVLAATSDDQTVAWYENNGARPPAFQRHVISSALAGARTVEARDMDGDGDLDVVAAAAAEDAIFWFENDGAKPPRFAPRAVSGQTANVLDAAVADFNGDGRPDVLAALKNANRIVWLENQPPAPLARKNFTRAWALYE